MYSINGQWELIETWAHRVTLHHSCCAKEVAQISYDIHIKRLPLFYITNFILPCALIAALNAMVFLTPAGRLLSRNNDCSSSKSKSNNTVIIASI